MLRSPVSNTDERTLRTSRDCEVEDGEGFERRAAEGMIKEFALLDG